MTVFGNSNSFLEYNENNIKKFNKIKDEWTINNLENKLKEIKECSNR